MIQTCKLSRGLLAASLLFAAFAVAAEEAPLRTYGQWKAICNTVDVQPQRGAPCMELATGSGRGKRGRGARVAYHTVAPSSEDMLVTLSGVVLAKTALKLVRELQEDSELRTSLLLKDGTSCSLFVANPVEGVSPLNDPGVLESFRRIYKEGLEPTGQLTTKKIVFKNKPAMSFDDQRLTGLYIQDSASVIWSACDGDLDKARRQSAQRLFDSIVMSSRAYY